MRRRRATNGGSSLCSNGSFLGLTTEAAQTPHGKPTERAIVEYEKFVADGAFLTPEGWKMAGNSTTNRMWLLAEVKSPSCPPEDLLAKTG
jgi:hypothetical protein